MMKFLLSSCEPMSVHLPSTLSQLSRVTIGITSIRIKLPDITGRTALAVRPDVLNAKYHVITNATYSCHNREPVPAKFKHVTNIETCMID